MERRSLQIAEQGIGTPQLYPVSLDIGVGSCAETLQWVEEQDRVPGCPIANCACTSGLRGMNGRLRNDIPELVRRGGMTHQVAELVIPVAPLATGDGGDLPMHIQSVRRRRSVPLAVKPNVSLAVDIGGRVENLVAEKRFLSNKFRGGFPGFCSAGHSARVRFTG